MYAKKIDPLTGAGGGLRTSADPRKGPAVLVCAQVATRTGALYIYGNIAKISLMQPPAGLLWRTPTSQLRRHYPQSVWLQWRPSLRRGSICLLPRAALLSWSMALRQSQCVPRAQQSADCFMSICGIINSFTFYKIIESLS